MGQQPELDSLEERPPAWIGGSSLAGIWRLELLGFREAEREEAVNRLGKKDEGHLASVCGGREMDLARACHGEKNLARNCRGKARIWREEEALHGEILGREARGSSRSVWPEKTRGLAAHTSIARL
jgi:hypothetical protein